MSSRLSHTWAGVKFGGGFAYLHVISFAIDSGVGIPVTLTFWPWGGGKHPSKTPPAPMYGESAFLGGKRNCIEKY